MDGFISALAVTASAAAIAYTALTVRQYRKHQVELSQRLEEEIREEQALPEQAEKLPVERFFYFVLKANMDFDTFPSDMPDCNDKLVRQTLRSLGIEEGEFFDKMVAWGLQAMDDLMEKGFFSYVEGLGTQGHSVVITRKWDRETRAPRNEEGEVIRPSRL